MDYKELKIWQNAQELAKSVYVVSASFPKEEVYGLTSQIRRSAVSVPSNIAEGHARHSEKDFARFLAISGGSLAELETQFLLAKDLNFIDNNNANMILEKIDNLKRMMWMFRKNVRDRIESAA